MQCCCIVIQTNGCESDACETILRSKLDTELHVVLLVYQNKYFQIFAWEKVCRLCTKALYDNVKNVFTYGKVSIDASRQVKEVFWGQAAFSGWWSSSSLWSRLNLRWHTNSSFTDHLMHIAQKKLPEISRFILIAFRDAPVNLEVKLCLQCWISTFEEEIIIGLAKAFQISDIKSLTFSFLALTSKLTRYSQSEKCILLCFWFDPSCLWISIDSVDCSYLSCFSAVLLLWRQGFHIKWFKMEQTKWLAADRKTQFCAFKSSLTKQLVL